LRSMRRILTAGLDGTERGSFEALEHAGRRYVAMLPQASQAKLRAGWGCCGELGQVWPLRNVWVGITAENQAQFDKRVYWLESIPAYKRWVSVEPLLGLLRFGHMKRLLDWIVVGGESGNKARIMQKDWLQAVVNEAQREFWGGPVPAYFKQWGAWGPVYDIGEGEAIAGRSSYVEQVGGVRYVKVGKKRAGNVLNGERIEQFPAFWKPNE